MGTRRRPRPRREPRRIDLARRGLAGVLVVGLLLALLVLREQGAFGGDPAVTATVRNAGGALRVGSDVKVAGVIVGRVEGIDRAPDGDVRLQLSLPEADLERVPENVVARILPATVFGTTFVDLVVYGSASARPLRDGAAIPADTSQGTLELQQALDDIDRLVNALGPAELNRALSALATALDGRGAQLGEMITTADGYLGRLEPRLPLLTADLRGLADNLEILDGVAPDLLSATEDALVVLETVVARRASITALITGGTTLVRESDDLLDETRRDAVRMLRNGAVLLDILYDKRSRISEAIRINILVGEKVPTAIRNGRQFLRSDSTFQLNNPAFYTRADRPDYGPPSALARASLRGLAGGGGR